MARRTCRRCGRSTAGRRSSHHASRTSAFAGTDLDLVLRARGVDSLALTGVATSAMIAAALYDASDRGYGLTVLRDGCADQDPAVHELLVDTVFRSRGAEIVTCAEWLAPSPARR